MYYIGNVNFKNPSGDQILCKLFAIFYIIRITCVISTQMKPRVYSVESTYRATQYTPKWSIEGIGAVG